MGTKIPDKARMLLEGDRIRKEMETDKRIHFTVRGETEDHSVIFDIVKGKWTCDCRFSALTNRECSHITACKMKG